MYYYIIKVYHEKNKRIESFAVSLDEEITALDTVKKKYCNAIDFDIVNEEVYKVFRNKDYK